MLPTPYCQQVFPQFRELPLLLLLRRRPFVSLTLRLPYSRIPVNQGTIVPRDHQLERELKGYTIGFPENEAKVGIILFIGLEY